MVTEVVDIKENSVVKDKPVEQDTDLNSNNAPLNAWKVVGSPARRASINPDPVEMNEMPKDMASRARAASIPGFSFHVEAEGPPPPGLKNGSDANGNKNGSDSGDDFRDMNDRISKESPQEAEDSLTLTEDEYMTMPKTRSRSKSSSAIFSPIDEDPFDPKRMPDMSAIWSDSKTGNPIMHRRASTQPSQETLMWEALRAAQLATPNDMNGIETDLLMERFKKEQLVNPRRMSVAPSMVNRFMNRNVDQETVLQVPGTYEQGRRHSMAGPIFDRKLNAKLTEGLKEMGLTEQLETIDDYFENTESRSRAFREAGKNLQAIQDIASPVPETPEKSFGYQWPLYVVEFKAGRTDYFYLPKGEDIEIKVGDLAIVEADRGKDLGKVIETNINTLAELQLYQATHVDPLVDSHNAIGKDIEPKKIYRLAAPNEVAMLISKSQDEAKANALCQTKIRAKKLPMEIVDAEYQWDRRKLTFYFVADRRIDFRELVRELFKIYKTRIWMCAVNPSE